MNDELIKTAVSEMRTARDAYNDTFEACRMRIRDHCENVLSEFGFKLNTHRGILIPAYFKNDDYSLAIVKSGSCGIRFELANLINPNAIGYRHIFLQTTSLDVLVDYLQSFRLNLNKTIKEFNRRGVKASIFKETNGREHLSFGDNGEKADIHGNIIYNGYDIDVRNIKTVVPKFKFGGLFLSESIGITTEAAGNKISDARPYCEIIVHTFNIEDKSISRYSVRSKPPRLEWTMKLEDNEFESIMKSIKRFMKKL